MKKFKFGIMGAGNIAVFFCKAVALLDNCTVVSVASKSMDKARQFADQFEITAAYDDYEKMLQCENLDCVYIATTNDAHYPLTMLCLDYKVPVLCEKAMFLNTSQAVAVFERSAKEKIFVMEGMWSRFLPTINMVKKWLTDNKIGKVVHVRNSIGFIAQKDWTNRYFNPALGGGAAFDLTVYNYDLTTFLFGNQYQEILLASVMAESGVDQSDHVTLVYEDMVAVMDSSFCANLDNDMVIWGENGKIVIPHFHQSNEAYLYGADGTLLSHFQDTETKVGLLYEIKEAILCIQNGSIESSVIPNKDTLACTEILEKLAKYTCNLSL